MNNQKIVLASTSEYRQALLKKLKIGFIAAAPNINESALAEEKPDHLAVRLAKQKAFALEDDFPDHLIIGSDQVAIFAGKQLQKPGSRVDTIRQLRNASGKKMDFFTGVCVLDSRTHHFISEVDICSVRFKTLSHQQIEHYVDVEKPYYCVGGFKSEGYGIVLLESIKGEDPNALVGLPLIKLTKILHQFDVHVV